MPPDEDDRHLLNAFRGIKALRFELGYFGASPNTEVDLADELQKALDNADEGIWMSLEVILQIANRIKQLAIERQGATWVGKA